MNELHGKIELLNKLSEVFRPASPISHPDSFAGRRFYLTQCRQIIETPGMHIALTGKKGVGKTSLANIVRLFHSEDVTESYYCTCDSSDTYDSVWRKVFSDWVTFDSASSVEQSQYEEENDNTPLLGIIVNADLKPRDIVDAFMQIGGTPLVIFDEFDRLADTFNKRLFAETIKVLSDRLPDVTLMIVGDASNISELIGEHKSIERNISFVRLPLMSNEEMNEILEKGQTTMGMTIEAKAREAIVKYSHGLPHKIHFLAYHTFRKALLSNRLDVRYGDFEMSVHQANDES